MDNAISGNLSSSAKRLPTSEIEPATPSVKTHENGDKAAIEPELGNESLTDDDIDGILENHKGEIAAEAAVDDDKLENDLLKDLDDDDSGGESDDLEKEVKELLESARVEGQEKPKETVDVNEEPTLELDGSFDENLLNDLDGDLGEALLEEDIKEEPEEPADDPTKAKSTSDDLESHVEDDLKSGIGASEQPEKPSEEANGDDDDVMSAVSLLKQAEIPSEEANGDDADKMEVDEKSDDKDGEAKADDLLVACPSPKPTDEQQQENISETSSSAGDTPEESSDEKQSTAENGPNEDDKSDKTDVEQGKASEKEAGEVDRAVTSENMEVDTSIDELIPTENGVPLATLTEEDDEVHLCIVEDESAEPPTPKVPITFKFKFMKKFAEAAGTLSRPELEELLVEKITESIMYCTENTNLRARMERQEKISEAYKKRLDNVLKQYQDLQMIHNRVMKDLKDRPEAPITPVKITRAVGLQVYQPAPRKSSMQSGPSLIKPANKRPMEPESSVNGSQVSPDNSKRKKIPKITPLRPPLSEKDRVMLELQEAKDTAKIRTNITKTLGNIPATVTMTVVNGSAPLNKSTASTSSNSIDLTDDEEGNSTVAKQPPPLAVFRGGQNPNPQQMRTAVAAKPTLVAAPNRIVQYRRKFSNIHKIGSAY